MNIGNLKANEAGIFMGRITTIGVNLLIALREVESNNDRAPRFEVHGRDNAQSPFCQVGALWEQTSNSSGEVFLQGSIDYPSLAKALPIAMFRQDDGSYNVAWSRPANRSTMAKNASPQNGSDGLGESTSGDAELPFGNKAKRKGKGVDFGGEAFRNADGELVTGEAMS